MGTSSSGSFWNFPGTGTCGSHDEGSPQGDGVMKAGFLDPECPPRDGKRGLFLRSQRPPNRAVGVTGWGGGLGPHLILGHP